MNARILLALIGVVILITPVLAIGNTPAVIPDKPLIVTNPPRPDFIADVTSGTAPLTVRFTDVSYGDMSSVTRRVWEYMETSHEGRRWRVLSTDVNPTFTFPHGTYFVSLTFYSSAYPSGFITNTRGDFITVIEPEPTPTPIPIRNIPAVIPDAPLKVNTPVPTPIPTIVPTRVPTQTPIIKQVFVGVRLPIYHYQSGEAAYSLVVM